MYVKIEGIEGDDLQYYAEEELKMPISVGVYLPATPIGVEVKYWERQVRMAAIEALWENRWVPGSISWRVYSNDNIPTDIGENY